MSNEDIQSTPNYYRCTHKKNGWAFKLVNSLRKREKGQDGRKKLITNTISDITVNYLINLLKKQNNKCFYSEKDLDLDNPIFNPRQPSLDRLDSNKGYTRDNVVICCLSENYGKSIFSMDVWLSYLCNNDNDKINLFKKKICEIENYYNLNPNYKKEEPEHFNNLNNKQIEIKETDSQTEIFENIDFVKEPKIIVCKKEKNTNKTIKPIQLELLF